MNESNKTLRQLQAELPCGANEYSAAFDNDATRHRDYKHATLHQVKAVGRLVEVAEEMDHEDQPTAFLVAARHREEDTKRLADLVIVAIRMANTHPSGRIDLATAVEARLAQKFRTGSPVAQALPRDDPHESEPR